MSYNFSGSQQIQPSFNFQNMLNNYGQEPSLCDKLKSANLQGVTTYSANDLATLFGEDCAGIDACCVNNKIIIAVKHLDSLTMNSTKDIAFFNYSCDIIEKSQNRKVHKMILSLSPLNSQANAIINRHGILSIINNTKKILTDEAVNRIITGFSTL